MLFVFLHNKDVASGDLHSDRRAFPWQMRLDLGFQVKEYPILQQPSDSPFTVKDIELFNRSTSKKKEKGNWSLRSQNKGMVGSYIYTYYKDFLHGPSYRNNDKGILGYNGYYYRGA